MAGGAKRPMPKNSDHRGLSKRRSATVSVNVPIRLELPSGVAIPTTMTDHRSPGRMRPTDTKTLVTKIHRIFNRDLVAENNYLRAENGRLSASLVCHHGGTLPAFRTNLRVPAFLPIAFPSAPSKPHEIFTQYWHE